MNTRTIDRDGCKGELTRDVLAIHLKTDNIVRNALTVKKGDLLWIDDKAYIAAKNADCAYDIPIRKEKPVVYLAGPMRGKPMHNFPAFLTAAAFLRSRGFDVVNPAEHDLETGFDMTKPLEGQKFDISEALRWDFMEILEADGIVLIDGWENSTGAKAERLVAEMSGRFVLRLDESTMKISVDEGWLGQAVWTPPKRIEIEVPADTEFDEVVEDDE